jgi:glycosyltransferase involved in cell wall biosynthesis
VEVKRCKINLYSYKSAQYNTGTLIAITAGKRCTMSKKKKVAIIGTVGLPANYGGFETLAHHLVDNLSDAYDFTVYCSGKNYAKGDRVKDYKGAKLSYVPFQANGIQSIIYDGLSILHSLLYADVLMVLGVSGAFLLPFVKMFTNKKIIVSIDGIEWKRAKWSWLAKWYLFWAESIAVKYSHVDISDNESIQDYTATRYGTLSRIIEYGADHVFKVAPIKEDKIEFPFLHKSYAFKVCRIEPENNLHVVLEAFKRLPKHTMVIVGNWSVSKYGKKLKQEYSKYSNIILLDPIYNPRKLNLLRSSAFVYVHGHSAGGTNPSLVEAMHLGLPIFAFDVSYNRTTTERKTLYFKTSDDLAHLIRSTQIDSLAAISITMKKIANRRYVWSRIASKYDNLIQEALTISTKTSIHPSSTQLDQDRLRELGLGHFKNLQTVFQKR